MLLLISHAGVNKGVTSYFRDFLTSRGIQYLYLRHPFLESSLYRSELVYTNESGLQSIMASYWRPNNELGAIVMSLFVTTWVLFRYGFRTSLVIGFGSFNVFSALFLRLIFSFKVYFWGVDYSSKRFSNAILNKTYFIFETIACKYSDRVIQPTMRQEAARMQIHGLIRGRSMVIPNGISESILMNPFKNSNDLRTAFLYFGSITQQHGVLEFIKEFYVGHKVQSHLYIIGGGPLSMVLTALIDDNNLSDRVHYLGYMTTDQMDNFIRTSEECFIGIAPYRIDGVNDHVYYGDSLKLKEYLAYYIPFLVSDIIEVPVDLTRFGVIYKTDAQLLNYLLMPSSIPPIGDTDVHNVLLSYTWNTLCSRIPLV